MSAQKTIYSYTASLLLLRTVTSQQHVFGRRVQPVSYMTDKEELEAFSFSGERAKDLQVFLIRGRSYVVTTPTKSFRKRGARALPGGRYDPDKDRAENDRDFEIIGAPDCGDLLALKELLEGLNIDLKTLCRTAVREAEEETGWQVEKIWLDPIVFKRREESKKDIAPAKGEEAVTEEDINSIHFHLVFLGKLRQGDAGSLLRVLFRPREWIKEIKRSQNWYPVVYLPIRNDKEGEPGLLTDHYFYIAQMLDKLGQKEVADEVRARWELARSRSEKNRQEVLRQETRLAGEDLHRDGEDLSAMQPVLAVRTLPVTASAKIAQSETTAAEDFRAVAIKSFPQPSSESPASDPPYLSDFRKEFRQRLREINKNLGNK